MSGYAENWASTPWKAPEPLEAVQHVRSLLYVHQVKNQGTKMFPKKSARLLVEFSTTLKRSSKLTASTSTWSMWNINVTPPRDETSSASGSVSPLITTRILVTIHITVPKRNITIGRRSMWSTFGSKRHGVPLFIMADDHKERNGTKPSAVSRNSNRSTFVTCHWHSNYDGGSHWIQCIGDTRGQHQSSRDHEYSAWHLSSWSSGLWPDQIQVPSWWSISSIYAEHSPGTICAIDSSDLAVVNNPVRVFVAKKTEIVRKLLQHIPYSTNVCT